MTELVAGVTQMVSIAAGEFVMGSESGGNNEGPEHPVWIDAFALAKFPVTRGQYAEFLAETGHQPPRYWYEERFADPQQPAVAPSWYDAQAYCAWLSQRQGKPVRLPTEAEREKAARGGLAGRDYPWGDQLPADCSGGYQGPLAKVGGEGPNGYGLWDMSAGVHEWCADWYDADYYRVAPYRNPQGPGTGVRRVARGGSWRHQIRFARCAARSSLPPDRQFSDFGFRIAMSL